MAQVNEPGWNWGPAWNSVRNDINVLAWLLEEQRVLHQLYMESMFFALTGVSFSVDQFAEEVGIEVAAEVSGDEHERAAPVALDPGGES